MCLSLFELESVSILTQKNLITSKTLHLSIPGGARARPPDGRGVPQRRAVLHGAEVRHEDHHARGTGAGHTGVIYAYFTA